MTFNPGVVPFRLRFSISNEGVLATFGPYQLYASKNGGAWTPVTTTSTIGVKSADAGSSADEATITISRLTAPP